MSVILALETSCDDTSAAVVENGRMVRASIVLSHTALHEKTGGVVPEVSSREHTLLINTAVAQAMQQANSSWSELSAIAATMGPGLIGSLLVGATAAKTLAWLHQKPFVAVNHLVGHVASNYLNNDLNTLMLEPPFLCLLVSGGHTMLWGVTAQDPTLWVHHGHTLDDAVGEAYDKVARLLQLPYPGGPHLDAMAASAAQTPDAWGPLPVLPTPKASGAYNFSLSGLKTAVSRQIEKKQYTPQAMAMAFQQTVVDMLVEKTWACAQAHQYPAVALCGGVSANETLRQALIARCHPLPVYVPPMAYCGDNAAMIAAAAHAHPLSCNQLDEPVFSTL